MRRLVFLASAIIFFDVAFYAAIAPLLPGYVDDLGLSKTQAGVLTASYAVGTLLNSLPAGFVATRLGPRRTVIAGLLLLGAASVVFGFAHTFPLLVAARFAQGISGAFTWTGALSWLVSASPEGRRGAVIGTALGTAVAGALLGPPLGALASSIGTAPVFSTVAVLTLVLAAAAYRLPDATERGTGGIGETLVAMTKRPVVIAIVMLGIPSLMFGLESVIVPLRINSLGGGPFLIAAGFTIGAAAESALAPLIGRYSDRVGRVRPYVAGMTICAFAILLIPVGHASWVVVVASVIIAVGAGFSFTPATAILTRSAENQGLHQGFGAALMNMTWAGGQIFGAIAGGALAEAFGYAVPCIVVAVLLGGAGFFSSSGALAQAEAATS